MNPTSKDIPLEADSMIIYQPRWTDDRKIRLKAIVRGPDGRFTELEVSKDAKRSPLLRDIFCQYTEKEIEAFTEREASLARRQEELEKQGAEDRRTEEAREITFQAKAKALELPEVRDCPDKRIGRKIRKATSPFEVAGWLAVAFIKSLEKEGAAI